MRLRWDREIPSLLRGTVLREGVELAAGGFQGDLGVFAGLPCGEVELVVEHPMGAVRSLRRSLRAEPPPSAEQAVELGPPCAWAVRAIDGRGRTIPTARHTVHPSVRGTPNAADGWIHVERCAGTFGSGFVLADGYLPRRVSAPPDGERIEVELEEAAPVRVELDCEPWPEASAAIWGPGGFRPCRDEGAAWRCDGLPGAVASVVAVLPGPAGSQDPLGRSSVRPGPEPALLRCDLPAPPAPAGALPAPLPEGSASLTLRVLDDSSQPLVGARAVLCADPDSCLVRRDLGRSDSEGVVAHGLPEGTFTLMVGADGYRSEERVVSLSADEPLAVDLVLRRGSRCMGVTLGSEGVVLALRPGGPEESSGLRAGDRIVEVDGVASSPPALSPLEAGASREVLVERPGGGEIELHWACPDP